MKKVFTLLTLALLSIGTAWAQSTIGLTQTVTDDGNTHTVGAATYTGTTNVTVTKSIGSSCGDGFTGKTVKVGSPEVTYSATNSFRKTVNGSVFVDAQYVGYTMAVASGYKVSLSNLNAEFWSSDANMTWKVVVLNPSGTQIYASSTAQNNSNNKGTIAVESPTGLANLTAGTYTIKLMMYQSGGNKYFVVPSLTFSATVEEDNSTTYTVTTSAGAGGTVSPSGAQTVTENNNISITATPNTGYAFTSWTVDGVENVSTANPYTFTNVTADHTIAAVFKQLYSVSYNVASENKGTTTKVLAKEYANVADKWTAPANYYTYSAGKTLTKWNDGANDYTPGNEYTLAGNITIAPVFADNAKYLGDLTAETTISWPFGTSAGAPTLNCEDNTQYYVKQATVAGNTVDVPILVNTENGYGISGSKGKFVGNVDYAQVNAGTVFKIPAVKGMVVKYMTNQTTQVSNIGFTDDTNDLGGDGSALTAPTVISNDNKTISYTYTGTADYLYLVDKAGGKYPTGLSVTYPEKQTKYIAPTITVGDFSFADKAYPVTITAAEGTLEVSTDGTNYTPQTSPYEVNVTATTHFYAKATGASFDDSDVIDENVVCTFDNAKKYVAWVYTKGYGSASYAFATDPMVTALQSIYNVVEVNYSESTTPSNDLNNADLIVCTEAMAGNKTMSNGMKAFAGVTPMIGLKAYNYTKGRWSWGTPNNPNPTTTSFKPKSTLYKVLSDVIYENDGTIKLATAASGNVIQTVQFGTTDTTAPEGNTILGNIDDTDNKAVMYASTKYFGLGLSSDCWSTYTANTITIVKNAAAMLIAGEALDAEVSALAVGTKAERNYATYVTIAKMDFKTAEGITAYIATGLNGAKDAVVLQEVDVVPASTPIIVKTTTKGATVNVPVTTADASDVSGNKLIAGDGVKDYDNGGNSYYYLASDLFHLANAGKLQSGKAYLEVAGSTPAPSLGIDFGNATGIGEIKSQKVENGQFFDLQGRKVAQPTKGLYIVNGRKVVIK